MKHDVSFFLLGILLMAVMGMIVLVIYYYTTFESLRSEYNVALADLDNMTVEANNTRNALNTRKGELDDLWMKYQNATSKANLSNRRVQSISDIYTEEKGRADTLSSNLNLTKDERDRYEKLYNQYYEDNKRNELRYHEAQKNYETERGKIIRIKADASSINSNVVQIESSLGKINDYVSYMNTNAGDIRDESNISQNTENSAKDIEKDVISITTQLESILENILDIKTDTASIGGS